MSTSPNATPRPSIAARDLILTLVLITFAIQSYGYVREFGFTGTDAIPTVDAARVDGASALLIDVMGRELRGDSAESGLSYYRPLTLLTYSFDYLIGGWSAKGYHFTDLMLHGLVGAAVFWTARLALGLTTAFAFLASLIFLLHPAAVEVVPAVSRRQEPLLVLGLALSVIGASRVPSRVGWAAMILGSLVAVTSVERGVVVPAVVFAYRFAFASDQALLRQRIQEALVCSLPSLAVAVGFLLLRGMILEDSRGLYFGWSNLLVIPGYLGLRTLYPQEFLIPISRPDSLAQGVFLAAVLVPVAALLTWAVASASQRATHLFVALALGSYLLLCAIAGQMNPWYVYSAVPFLAFSIAALGAESAQKIREGITGRGVGYAISCVILVVLVAYPSPVFHDYSAWRVADQLARTLLGELETIADRVPNDTAIVVLNTPLYFRENDSGAFVTNGAVSLWPRTVRVWARVKGIENEILVIGDSWHVEQFKTPIIEATDRGTLLVYFPPGLAQYHSQGVPGTGMVPLSLGNGREFVWPPSRLTSARFRAYVFDGEALVPMEPSLRSR